MKLYDIIIGTGFATACFYAAHRFGLIKLDPEIVQYVSKFPEFFIGAAGIRIADKGLEKLVGIKDYLLRIGIGAVGILTAGTLHELGPNGINSPSDIAQYGIGIGLSAIVGMIYNKKRNKNLAR